MGLYHAPQRPAASRSGWGLTAERDVVGGGCCQLQGMLGDPGGRVRQGAGAAHPGAGRDVEKLTGNCGPTAHSGRRGAPRYKSGWV